MEWKWERRNNNKFITIDSWLPKGALMAFSTRHNGYSSGNYASLNLAFHNGDVKESVIKNRVEFLQALEVNIENLVSCEQVHSANVQMVGSEHAGKGSTDYESAITKCDALVTNSKDLFLLTCYADCFPVYFFDPVVQAVAIAHCGWQGVYAGIVEATIEEMKKSCGCRVSDIEVFIGPGIQSCCFEIAEDLARSVESKFNNPKILTLEAGSIKWDLPLTIMQLLSASGINMENVSNCELCTSCCPDYFFSYRRDNGITGRMAAIIGLR